MLVILCQSSIWALNSVAGSAEEESQGEGSVSRDCHRRACLSRLALPQAALAILAFTSYHVQIITRISSGYPLWYWYLAAEILDDGKLGRGDAALLSPKKIIQGMVLYGLIQGALFACFLPPA
jgi:phosphatidylinositol glycan class V